MQNSLTWVLLLFAEDYFGKEKKGPALFARSFVRSYGHAGYSLVSGTGVQGDPYNGLN